ncbi:MAG: tetratricopeptide repeat protein [Phycisphaerales bacterium]|jgi:hypothetical protein
MQQNESAQSKQFLSLIRADSAYPRIRKRIESIVSGWMSLGALILLAAAICLYMCVRETMNGGAGVASVIFGVAFLLGLALGLMIIEFARYLRERMSMQVDMADSLLRIGSRTPVQGVPVAAELPNLRAVSDVSMRAPLLDSPVAPAEPDGGASTDREKLAKDMYRRAKEHLRGGSRQKAIETLRELINEYPETVAAAMAREQLRKSGHL